MAPVPLYIRYLALGDSYTIGTGASDESRNFPSRLAAELQRATGRRVEIRNPAVNGFTTGDVIRHEIGEVKRFRPDLVTILIGANDVVQGSGEGSYRRQLQRIYAAVKVLNLPPGRVVAISIPDFSTAPAATAFGSPASLRSRIDAFNRIAEQEASSHGFEYLDLGEVSRLGEGGPGWIADDGLHPGDAQYAAWADYLWENVRNRWTLSYFRA